MRRLFICERPYPLYRTLLRAIDSDDQIDIVLGNQVDGMEQMYNELVESEIFGNVYFFDDATYKEFVKLTIMEHQQKPQNMFLKLKKLYLPMIRKFFSYLKLQQKAKYIKFPENLDFDSYDDIYVNDCTSSLNFYLYHKKKEVICVEHARNVFIIFNTSEVFSNVLEFLDRLHISYALRGACRYNKAVEVSENSKDIYKPLQKKKIIELPLEDLVGKLSDTQKERIFELYRKAYGIPGVESKVVDVVITQPLTVDGYVKNMEKQIEVYQKIIDSYSQDSDLILVKPHPRDFADYAKLNGNIKIVHPCVSSEILAISQSLKIRNAITISSTSVGAFSSAENTVVLTKDYCKKV